METASRAPAQGRKYYMRRHLLDSLLISQLATFDQQQNAIHNEAHPTSTSNAGVGVPTINTTTSSATGTTTGANENSPGYIQQAREALASLAGTVQNAVGIGKLTTRTNNPSV